MARFDDLPPEKKTGERVGIDLLLTRQVAENENVHSKTVERWISKGLPAVTATKEQLGALVAAGYLSSVPPHGVVYLIHEADLALIPQISRTYTKKKTGPRRGKKTGAGDVERG